MKLSVLGVVAAVLISASDASSNVTYGRGSPGCGKKVKHLGSEYFVPKWNVSGVWRQYRTYTPKHYEKDKPVPLLLAFHANAKPQPRFAMQSRFSDPTINPNMMVQYMVAYKKRWVGPTSAHKDANDIEFVARALEVLMNNYCIDVDRVFLTGHAGGGGLANILACHPRLSRHFAGMALMGPTLYQDLNDDFCKGARLPMPVLEAHGLLDETSPYWGEPARTVGAVPAVLDWLRRWVRRNDCDPVPRRSHLVKKAVVSHKYTCQGQFGFVEHITAARQNYNWLTTKSAIDISPVMIDFFNRWVRPGNLSIPLDAKGRFVVDEGPKKPKHTSTKPTRTRSRRPTTLKTSTRPSRTSTSTSPMPTKTKKKASGRGEPTFATFGVDIVSTPPEPSRTKEQPSRQGWPTFATWGVDIVSTLPEPPRTTSGRGEPTFATFGVDIVSTLTEPPRTSPTTTTQ
ncbi:ferulic acid esterase [Cordyceps militaris]|uniref:feruloyl esterase n=1 Tax=Cordyceps militaris TaxID=73501 RepID=A0A2H4S9H2_CORMI|nr:ferulic acid esterase [Cordyceps militaris]